MEPTDASRSLLQCAQRTIDHKTPCDIIPNLNFILMLALDAAKEKRHTGVSTKDDASIEIALLEYLWHTREVAMIAAFGTSFVAFILARGAFFQIPHGGAAYDHIHTTLQLAEDISLGEICKLVSSLVSKTGIQLHAHVPTSLAAEQASHVVLTQILPGAVAHVVRDAVSLTWPSQFRATLASPEAKRWVVAVFSFLLSGQRIEGIESALAEARVDEWPTPTNVPPAQIHLRRFESAVSPKFPALHRHTQRLKEVVNRIRDTKEAARLSLLPDAEREAEIAMKRGPKTTPLGIPLAAKEAAPPKELETAKRGFYAIGCSPALEFSLQRASTASRPAARVDRQLVSMHHGDETGGGSAISPMEWNRRPAGGMENTGEPRGAWRRENNRRPSSRSARSADYSSHRALPRIPVRAVGRPLAHEAGVHMTAKPRAADVRALLRCLLPETVQAAYANQTKKASGGPTGPSTVAADIRRRPTSRFMRMTFETAVRQLAPALRAVHGVPSDDVAMERRSVRQRFLKATVKYAGDLRRRDLRLKREMRRSLAVLDAPAQP